MSYSSCSCFGCLTGPYIFVYLAQQQLKFGTILSYWPLDVQHGPSGHINSEDLRIRIVALHKDGRGYKKFGNSLELSYSTVARVIQRVSKMVFTRNRPHKGRLKKLSYCAVRQVQKLASKNRLNSSPRAPPLCIFCMSLFVNTPDSDNQLVRMINKLITLHAWTVFLHRVHCSLLREDWNWEPLL